MAPLAPADTAETRPPDVDPAFPPTRLIVVDDHPAVRSSLRRLLADEEDLEVVDVLPSADMALAIVERESIDVAVVDYQLGGRHNGLWLSRKLKRLPHPPKVLVYSAYCDALLAAAAVVAQADGVVSKAGMGSKLCHAIRTVPRRQLALPVASRQLEQAIRSRLSEEEQIIFGMLLNGIELDEVAAVLDYSQARLEARLSTMLSKLEDVPFADAGADRTRTKGHSRGLLVARFEPQRLARASS